MTIEDFRTAEETFAAAELAGRVRPPFQDYTGAPEVVQAFVAVALTPDVNDTAIFIQPTAAVKSLGEQAIPWWKKFVFDGREFHPQPRVNAAMELARFGHLDDLMEALSAPGFDTPFAVENAIPVATARQTAADAERCLEKVEQIARTSVSWPTRSAAIWILGQTEDQRFLPTFVANLAYSGWATLLENSLAASWPPAITQPLRRILLASARPADYGVRSRAIDCLGKLERPDAIPALLEAAERSGDSFRRREALEALSNITKVNFGVIPSVSMPNTEATSERLLPVVWKLLRESGDSAVAELTTISEQFDESLRQDLAGQSARKVLDSWAAWWKSTASSPHSQFAERIVSQSQYPATNTRIVLFSSGQIETVGPKPGGGGWSRFTDLDSFEQYVATVAPLWLDPRWDRVGSVELRSAINKWVQSEVIPQFKKAQGAAPE